MTNLKCVSLSKKRRRSTEEVKRSRGSGKNVEPRQTSPTTALGRCGPASRAKPKAHIHQRRVPRAWSCRRVSVLRRHNRKIPTTSFPRSIQHPCPAWRRGKSGAPTAPARIAPRLAPYLRESRAREGDSTCQQLHYPQTHCHSRHGSHPVLWRLYHRRVSAIVAGAVRSTPPSTAANLRHPASAP